MSLLPSKQELKLLASQMNEAVSLYGLTVIRNREIPDGIYDDSAKPGEADSLKVLLVENPSKKLLNTLGWWNTDFEGEVLVVYFPFEINGNPTNPQRGDILTFPDRFSVQVQQINRDYLNGVFYTLNCSPYLRDNRDLSVEKEGTKTTFLKQHRKEVL